MVAGSDTLLQELGTALKTVDELTARVEEQVVRLNNENEVVKKLVYEKEIFETLVKVNGSLNDLIKFINEGGISDIVDFWKNIHLIGANPTKKK
jgi:hypothetical protein